MITYEQFKAITEDKSPIKVYYSLYTCFEDYIINGVYIRYTWLRGGSNVEVNYMNEVDGKFSIKEED